MSLHLGDCVAWLATLDPESVDSIVCDPPYELTSGKKGGTGAASLNPNSPAGQSRIGTGGGFMGQAWDASGIAHDPAMWAACLRVLKPGGHLVAFGGTRTVHRLVCAVEDAGFEVRDQLGWCFYSGFPKSLDVSKAIDRAAGAERKVVGPRCLPNGRPHEYNIGFGEGEGYKSRPHPSGVTAPATPDAVRWAGWGSGLKPAIEPAVLARKPFVGTIAANVLRHGTGALNIDGCRFAPGDPAWVGPDDGAERGRNSVGGGWREGSRNFSIRERRAEEFTGGAGRWPANLYYCPKASRRERERGCDGLPARAGHEAVEREEGSAGLGPRAGAGASAGRIWCIHPTVKPVRLMRWLCRLVTPPGGLVVDPFTGSGSTGVAAVLEGFRFAGAEMGEEYHRIACARIEHARRYPESWADTEPGSDGEADDFVEAVERQGQIRLFGGGA